MDTDVTSPAKPRRIALRALEPGQKLIHIEAKKLRGPRGGQYEFRFVAVGGTFTHSTLSADGRQRTFHFERRSPITLSDRLSCLLVAAVRDPS